MSTTQPTAVGAETSSSGGGAAVAADAIPREYFDCPVERDVLGRHSWTLLHTMAATVPDKPTRQQQQELSQFMSTLSKFYPCSWCADELGN